MEKNNKKLPVVIEDDDSANSFAEFAKTLDLVKTSRSNCKLCQSSFRQDAEDMYAKSQNAYQVYMWLKRQGEELSHTAVANHLKHHLAREVETVRLKEYSEELEIWLQNNDISYEKRVNMFQKMVERQIHLILSCQDNINALELRKNAESLCKLHDQYIKLQDSLDKKNNQIEPLEKFFELFQESIMDKLEKVDSKETKEFALDILVEIETSYKGLLEE